MDAEGFAMKSKRRPKLTKLYRPAGKRVKVKSDGSIWSFLMSLENETLRTPLLQRNQNNGREGWE